MECLSQRPWRQLLTACTRLPRTALERVSFEQTLYILLRRHERKRYLGDLRLNWRIISNREARSAIILLVSGRRPVLTSVGKQSFLSLGKFRGSSLNEAMPSYCHFVSSSSFTVKH
jgi:hypothetical protein